MHGIVFRMKILSLVALSLFATACQSTPAGHPPVSDPHSYAEPERVRVTHVALDLTLDFEAARAEGAVELFLERSDPSAALVLDSAGLAIEGITGSDGTPRAFRLGAIREGFGAPLSVPLEAGDESVRIAYHTTEHAEALQWLAPEQTAGGKQPFLFTQGQAILTRTWIPLQDSPSVRVTYSARVRVPDGLTAVMSAEQKGRADDGAFLFELDKPIPPYLIALACGELESRAISERCAVWAEPSIVDSAADEFRDTEAMIQSAERLFGPYRWGRYDMIVLPPAFPYGGMENPLLTFLTPTLIAGDRSLVSVIAHELAHSWSGNLVTNATWRDFWLNEGFTTYFEKRVMEEVFGSERAQMEMMLERQGLVDAVAGSEPWETVLYIDLDQKHPDEGFSSIPYDKGAFFLRRLEQVFGRENFDGMLRKWFDRHAFTSVTTPHFELFLQRELLDAHPELAATVDIPEWLYEPGLPADLPVIESDAMALVDSEIEQFVAGKGASELATESWTTQQWLRFLTGLPDELSSDAMTDLDQAFALTAAGNNEILFAWLRLSIQHNYSGADQRLESFLMNVGRRKYLQPLYEELVKTSDGLTRARTIYANARPRYHSVSSGTLDGIVLERE